MLQGEKENGRVVVVVKYRSRLVTRHVVSAVLFFSKDQFSVGRDEARTRFP